MLLVDKDTTIISKYLGGFIVRKYQDASLLEVAIEEMKRKRKPRTLEQIIPEVFQIKGIKETVEHKTQFVMDFMLSGSFVCCGENNRGKKVWDLKERQLSSTLDKEGIYYDELYEEEIIKYELDEDDGYHKISKGFHDDDDDDDEDETDEIAEDLSELELEDED